MRFRDTRPEPATGAKYLALSVGAALATAFGAGSQEAFSPPRKDPHRSPMHVRFQAAVRAGFAEASRARPRRFHTGYWKARRAHERWVSFAMAPHELVPNLCAARDCRRRATRFDVTCAGHWHVISTALKSGVAAGDQRVIGEAMKVLRRLP